MMAAKKELAVAKGIRKNKEEYELLAKMIDKVPSRSETNKLVVFASSGVMITTIYDNFFFSACVFLVHCVQFLIHEV